MAGKTLELKLKNFWRKNEKLIIQIVAAFLIGTLMAGVNYLNNENKLQKFSLDEPQVINNREQAEFTFQLEQPSLQKDMRMRTKIENMRDNVKFVVNINDQRAGTITQAEQMIKIPTDLLDNENKVVIKRNNLAFTDQELVSVEITSTTSFDQLMFVMTNFAALLLMFAPILYIKYEEYLEKKKMEEKFPEFLRDIVEGTRAGMSLPQAIQNSETGSYGPLDQKIQKMDAQLDWGIPFEKVLRNFGRETGSPIVKRSVDTIIQAYQSGGNIQDVLESVGDNIRSIKKLKEERKSQLYGEMVTGYIVYFIFIGILIALTTFLLPNLAKAQGSLGGSMSLFGNKGGATLEENISLYKTWFQRLVYIQALFSGLIIGKLSEGELSAGFKHTAILFAAGYLATTFFL